MVTQIAVVFTNPTLDTSLYWVSTLEYSIISIFQTPREKEIGSKNREVCIGDRTTVFDWGRKISFGSNYPVNYRGVRETKGSRNRDSTVDRLAILKLMKSTKLTLSVSHYVKLQSRFRY